LFLLFPSLSLFLSLFLPPPSLYSNFF
jgi:hypothetical protein